MKNQKSKAKKIKDEFIPLILEYFLGAIENNIMDDDKLWKREKIRDS